MSAYTHLHLPDAEDIAPDHGIGEVLEGRFVSGDLGGSVVGLSYQRLRPGGRIPFGHRHTRQEEVYVVLAGSGRANVGGSIVELARLDALRVAPEVWRALEAGPDGMELIAIGAPISAERDSEIDPGWWPEP
jgi:quercetin dioxygenase-like cupin family protein